MWGGELPIICANNGNVTRTTTFVNREYSFCWGVTFSPGSFHVRSFRNMQYLGWLLMDSHWYSWIDKEHFYPLCTAVNIIGNIVVNQMDFLFHNHRRHNTKKNLILIVQKSIYWSLIIHPILSDAIFVFNIPFSMMNYHQSESLVNKRQHRENWARPIKNPPISSYLQFLIPQECANSFHFPDYW